LNDIFILEKQTPAFFDLSSLASVPTASKKKLAPGAANPS
jgi:hypothetical protein